MTNGGAASAGSGGSTAYGAVPRPVRIGALIWAQQTDWPSLMEAARVADDLGYDDIWAWDHLLPLKGHADGPIHEAFMTLAGWVGVTGRARLGAMVAANTFRNPALAVKMITALDHMSGGRMVFGLGGAWYEPEHTAYGFDFGASPGERLDRLDEATAMARLLLGGQPASAGGPYYSAQRVPNDPPPVQSRLPLLIGGGGERKTLQTVARFADIWNIGGDLEEVRHKDTVLREWCLRVGRDHAEIERSLGLGIVVIRDNAAEAEHALEAVWERNGRWQEEDLLLGSPDQIVESLTPFVELGFRTMHFDLPAPFDRETLERFLGEVKPALAAVAARSDSRER